MTAALEQAEKLQHISRQLDLAVVAVRGMETVNERACDALEGLLFRQARAIDELAEELHSTPPPAARRVRGAGIRKGKQP